MMDGQFQPRDTQRAKELRNAATPAERTLWRCLSGRKVGGWKFSRQMPVGPYFADFLCREAQLIVELDGCSHDMRKPTMIVGINGLQKTGFESFVSRMAT